MISQSQLYERTIDGFLATLEQLGSPEQPSATETHELQTFPVKPPASLLGDREMQILEEAMSDIEQMMQQRQQFYPHSRD